MSRAATSLLLAFAVAAVPALAGASTTKVPPWHPNMGHFCSTEVAWNNAGVSPRAHYYYVPTLRFITAEAASTPTRPVRTALVSMIGALVRVLADHKAVVAQNAETPFFTDPAITALLTATVRANKVGMTTFIVCNTNPQG